MGQPTLDTILHLPEEHDVFVTGLKCQTRFYIHSYTYSAIETVADCYDEMTAHIKRSK